VNVFLCKDSIETLKETVNCLDTENLFCLNTCTSIIFSRSVTRSITG
jgi:hypothetical protein